MNKSDLAQQVAQQVDGLSQADAAAAVDAIFGGDGIIASALADSDAVTIAGFGKFEARKRAARDGRNPATGESVTIAAKTVPAFKAARALRDRVDG